MIFEIQKSGLVKENEEVILSLSMHNANKMPLQTITKHSLYQYLFYIVTVIQIVITVITATRLIYTRIRFI